MRLFFVFLCILSIVAGVGLSYGTELSRSYEQALVSQVDAARVSNRLLTARLAREREESSTLLFVGDIMLSRAVGKQIAKHGDPRYPFLLVGDVIRGADLAFGNLEGPISARGKNQGSEYSFRADPTAVEGLVFAGFDVLSLANNHIWDWGAEALQDTVALLHENGIIAVGAGRDEAEANAPRVFTLRGTRIAFLAYTNLMPRSLAAQGDRPGISAWEKAAETIAEADRAADIVVVSMHWGEEYEPRANATQRELARRLLEAGADLVVGHHPHVPQELERFGEGWVAYSLGNFVFDQNFSCETMGGMILRVLVRDKAIVSAELIPVTISDTFQPYVGILVQ